MAELDAAMEVRSEDESDAGSLVDFICDEDSISESEGEDAPVSLVSSFIVQEGRRRSTRRVTAPERYVDPLFVELMTEDATIEDVLEDPASSPSEAASESDSSYASESGDSESCDSESYDSESCDSESGDE